MRPSKAKIFVHPATGLPVTVKDAYKVTMSDGQSFLMQCDMSRAQKGIWVNWYPDDEDGWAPTPYQTADARHNIRRAAKLAFDYEADPEDRETVEVSSVEEVEE